MIAKVHLAPNEWIQSTPEELLDDLLNAIRERNTRGVLEEPPTPETRHA